MDPFVLEEQKLARRRRAFGLVAGSLVLIFVLYWLSGFSFIEITTTGQGGGNLEYSLKNQKNTGASEITSTNATKVKKLVRKGSFEITVKQSDRSAFSVVVTKGFFRTSKVQANLQKEKARQFIGGNPSSCMYMFEQTLVSYSCGGPYQGITLHVPASDNQATYNFVTPSLRQGAIEGLVRIDNQEFVIVKNFFEISNENPAHAAYAVGSDLSIPTIGIALPALRSDDLYTITPYKKGFLAYNSQLTHLVYYTSINDRPETIAVSPPEDKEQVPYMLTTLDDTIAIAYSKPTAHGQPNLDDPKTTAKQLSTISLRTDKSSRQFTLKKRYESMHLCGTDRICMLHNKQLDVYDISKDNPVLLFVVTNVNEFTYTNGTLLAVNDKGVLSLDTSIASGSMQYSFGPYTFCGIQPSGSSYLLCVINQKQKKVALLISPDEESDGIDQKIANLLLLTEVKDISVYKNSIFISPNAGQISYQPSLGGYGYNPETIKLTNNKIDSEIDRVGIDRNRYRIVNTLQ